MPSWVVERAKEILAENPQAERVTALTLEIIEREGSTSSYALAVSSDKTYGGVPKAYFDKLAYALLMTFLHGNERDPSDPANKYAACPGLWHCGLAASHPFGMLEEGRVINVD